MSSLTNFAIWSTATTQKIFSRYWASRATLGEEENKVGADDEVTSTAKNATVIKELFANTSQFAKLRYEGYKKLSEEK